MTNIFLILGGIVGSPLLMGEEIAIAQTSSYPRYDVTAQHTGSGCLNVRTAPHPAADIVACVSNGSILKPVVSEQNGWIQLSSGNWTWKESTSLKTVMPPVNAGFPVYGVVVQTPADCSNVRKTPSVAGEIVDCIKNSEVLKPIIGEQNGWLQLSSGNWIWKGNTNY